MPGLGEFRGSGPLSGPVVGVLLNENLNVTVLKEKDSSSGIPATFCANGLQKATNALPPLFKSQSAAPLSASLRRGLLEDAVEEEDFEELEEDEGDESTATRAWTGGCLRSSEIVDDDLLVNGGESCFSEMVTSPDDPLALSEPTLWRLYELLVMLL